MDSSSLKRDAEPFASFETARLRLRCVDLSDAQDLSALMTPGISALVASWPAPFTPTMAADRIQSAVAAAIAGTALPCVLEDRAGGALLGWISVVRDGDRGSLGVARLRTAPPLAAVSTTRSHHRSP